MNVYVGMIELSVFVASAMLVIFGALILYRWWGEKKSSERRALHTDVSRSYIQRIAGQRADTSQAWTKPLRLEVVSHLLLLLRTSARNDHNARNVRARFFASRHRIVAVSRL